MNVPAWWVSKDYLYLSNIFVFFLFPGSPVHGPGPGHGPGLGPGPGHGPGMGPGPGHGPGMGPGPGHGPGMGPGPGHGPGMGPGHGHGPGMGPGPGIPGPGPGPSPFGPGLHPAGQPRPLLQQMSQEMQMYFGHDPLETGECSCTAWHITLPGGPGQ